MKQTKIDEYTFRYLYDLYFNDLCKSINYYTSNVEVIEDIVQDLFVSLWENREKVNIFHIKTYLFTSVRNKMLNLLRDSKQFEILLDENHIDFNQPEEDQPGFNEELYQLTRDAIDTLPMKCKELFLLSKKENKTYKQIANEKNITVKTVENQMGIAYRKIREYVSEKVALTILL